MPAIFQRKISEQRSKPSGKGLYKGLNWVVHAKAKTQLAKAGRKVGEDQMNRPILNSDISKFISYMHIHISQIVLTL